MNVTVHAAAAVAWVLGAAVLLASARLLWRGRRAGARPRPWRTVALLAAQAAAAALLYLALFPPQVPVPAGAMTVLTADAARVPEVPAAVARARVVALPESGAPGGRWAGAERVPDLASALRRHRGIHTLHVVGAGLPARDREAARGLALRFHPAPLPRGLVELQAPAGVAAGRRFAVHGRVHALAGGSVELLDPAGDRIDRVAADGDGGFLLHGQARSAGPADFTLQLRDGRGRVVERVALPLQVLPARPLRARVLAGAPDPELKFLRRWALDAGIVLQTRIALGAGMRIGSRPAVGDTASLDGLDLLVVDERSWRALGPSRRRAVLDAVERGLGLLLRVSAAAGAADREALQALGFAARPDTRRELRLGAGFVRAGDAADALPPLTASPLRVSADDGVVALAAGDGRALAVWRARGRGRIGVAAFDDSFRLVLAGRGDAHGEVWSRLATVLARPLAGRDEPVLQPAVPGERSVLCGLGAEPQVRTPLGRTVRLHVDPRTGAARCAGFWATASGWHLLAEGGRRTPFFVPDSTGAPALRASALQAGTRALATARPDAGARGQASTAGPRWPWFLAWLAVATALWWLERSRLGLGAAPAGKD